MGLFLPFGGGGGDGGSYVLYIRCHVDFLLELNFFVSFRFDSVFLIQFMLHFPMFSIPCLLYDFDAHIYVPFYSLTYSSFLVQRIYSLPINTNTMWQFNDILFCFECYRARPCTPSMHRNVLCLTGYFTCHIYTE